MESELSSYLQRFTNIANSMLNCGTILNWFEVRYACFFFKIKSHSLNQKSIKRVSTFNTIYNAKHNTDDREKNQITASSIP